MITNVSDKELKKNIKDLLEHPRYVLDKFTPVIKSIVKQESFSEKQKHLLIIHLKKFWGRFI